MKNGSKWISFDIESDFRKKCLSLGWCSNRNKDQGKEYFFWQDESKLYYPNNCDPKYRKCLKVWRPAQKTKMADALRDFLSDVAGKIVVGWNIKSFDIPIIRKMIKNHLDIDWNPMYFDGYVALAEYVKTHPKLENFLKESNGLTPSGKFAKKTAETMFRYVTGAFGYIEYHSALYDAQDERLLIKLMAQKWGLSPTKMAKKYRE